MLVSQITSGEIINSDKRWNFVTMKRRVQCSTWTAWIGAESTCCRVTTNAYNAKLNSPRFWACLRGGLLTTWQYDKIWIDVKLQIVITRVIWTGEDQLQRQVELKDLIHRGTWNPGKNWQQWLSQDSTQPLDFTSWRKASWSEFLGTAKQKKTSEFAKRLPW